MDSRESRFFSRQDTTVLNKEATATEKPKKAMKVKKAILKMGTLVGKDSSPLLAVPPVP